MPYSMKGLRTVMFVGCAFTLGVTVVAGWSRYVYETRPTSPILLDYEIAPRGPNQAALWLRMHWRVKSAAACIRQGVQLIYRDVPDRPRDYFFLAASLNGAGLKGTVNDYTTWYALPVGIPPGQWSFLFRSFYTCPPFGLVRWETTTDPLTFTVP